MFALNEIYKHNKGYLEKDDYVCVTTSGNLNNARNIRRTLNSMQKNANTKVQNSGLHVLRHTFASLLLRNKVDIKVISELLGHKKASTTYDIYAHLIQEQKDSAIEQLDNI